MQTSKSSLPLEVVLRENIADGKTIFQGSRPSRPLEDILARSSSFLKPHFIDLREHDRVVEYCREDQVISVETGMTIGALDSILAANGQYLPCFAHREQTILDVINSGETGYLEHSYGLRSLVLGLDVILASGEKIKTGGKVVKNVSGYDLTKLFLGSRGTLGLPAKAHLRVYAVHEQSELYLASGLDTESLLDLSTELIRSGLPLAGLELVSDSTISPQAQTGPDPAFLMVAVSEHKDVVSELQPLLDRFFSNAGASITRVEPDRHRELITSNFKPFEWDNAVVVTSVSRVQASALLAVLRECGAYQMLYRPGSGRLFVRFVDFRHVSDLLKQISTAAIDYHKIAGIEDLEFAFADSEFEYRLVRPGSADSEVDHIKQQIKQKFDPENKMNPLAKL